jgi:hypothetical protein
MEATMTQSQLFEYAYPAGVVGTDPSAVITVWAERTATPGLIVTPYEPLDPPRDFRGKRFVITHEATGTRVTPDYVKLSRRVARLVAGALGGVCDWTFTDRATGSKTAWDALTTTGMVKWLREELS